MILRLHHVLAGCIDSLVVEETLDWKGVLGLLLWYPAPDANLYESPMSTEEPSKKGNGLIESMKMARQKDKKKTKTQPPALPYDVVSPQIPYLSPNNQIENSNTSSPSFSDSTVASGLLYPFDKASRFSTRFHRSSLISETPFFQVKPSTCLEQVFLMTNSVDFSLCFSFFFHFPGSSCFPIASAECSWTSHSSSTSS